MRELLRGLSFFTFCAFIIACAATFAHADWIGPVSPEMESWFRAQTNRDNQVCCDNTEAMHVDDYQWRGDHFDVTVDGQTFAVPPLKEAAHANRYGQAIIWVYPRGAPISPETIRCFMRATEG